MKCQILLSGKNKKNITNLSPAEFAHRVVDRDHEVISGSFLSADLRRAVISYWQRVCALCIG